MPDYEPTSPPACPEGAQPPTLTAEEEVKYKEVLEHFSKSDYVVPGVEKGELMEEEQFWLSYECLLRYLRATKWNVALAIERLEATLKWRREYGLYSHITAEYVKPESLTGKAVIFGYDVERRPALYLLPSRQNTEEPPQQIEFTFFMLERTIELMGPGIETLALMIDYADRANKSPSFNTSRTVLNILQTHYPERLGRALILNVPFILKAFYRLITPFIDPMTRPKMRFNPQVVTDGLFTADQVVKNWGGERDLEWDHDKYWPALIRMCAERKAENLERWRSLGGRLGLKEWDFKGGPAVASTAEASGKTQDIAVSVVEEGVAVA
ncbi:hypothetical protein JAAARDRAFT_35722 [Jaapia argillacea MUCL 33604]|uniref:CRAL-TRIO domain-containing protein n=1 Tax=Jaapia argillacea MUCL 33604 TaxID=933084 RepID=A0A067PQM3_9AGAM|nr:hypothetical protein JAAARDRAFT_35722 [Jaapia argillacea MUCL 33604]